MSSRVKGDRVARSEVLRKGRERLIAFQRLAEEARKSAEEARKSRVGDWMSVHVKFNREWSPTWDGVMRAMPVGEVGYSALSRSSRPCPSFSLPVTKGPSGSMKAHAPSVPPSPVPLFASFSVFLEDNDDDDDLNEEAVDPPNVSVVGEKVQRARVAHCARLGTLEWKDLKRKVPESLLEGPPGLENSAAAAVWDVLEDIGTGSPGWNRCGAAKARGRFV